MRSCKYKLMCGIEECTFTITKKCKFYRTQTVKDNHKNAMASIKKEFHPDDYNYSYPEMSNLLKVSTSRVDQIVRRAMFKIKRELLRNPKEYPDIIQQIHDDCDDNILNFLTTRMHII